MFSKYFVYLEHWEDMIMPEASVGEIYFRNVAKQFLCVNFIENHVVLQIAEAIKEQLEKLRGLKIV